MTQMKYQLYLYQTAREAQHFVVCNKELLRFNIWIYPLELFNHFKAVSAERE